MSIFDTYRKKQEEKSAPVGVPPVAGHTLAEILQDKKRSHLFGQLLEKSGHDDIAQRMAENNLNEGDIHILEEQRKHFSEKILQAKEIEKFLTKEQVISLARGNPDFEKIVNLVGPEKAIKVFKGKLEDLAITDPDRLEWILAGSQNIDSYKKNGEYKKLEEEVQKMCEKHKINSSEYMDALTIEDVGERNEALRKLVRGKYGFLKKHFDSIAGSLSFLDVIELGNQKSKIDKSMAELNSRLSDVGSLLAMTYSQNEDMRSAFSHELTGAQNPKEEKFGFSEAKPKEEDMKKRWKEFQTTGKFDASKLSPADLENRQDQFATQYSKEYKEKNKDKGFWASIFDAIFEEMLKHKKGTLK